MTDKQISFKNYCACGGFAWQMNRRPEAQPHMDWCPQREEYAEWFKRTKGSTNAVKAGERSDD